MEFLSLLFSNEVILIYIFLVLAYILFLFIYFFVCKNYFYKKLFNFIALLGYIAIILTITIFSRTKQGIYGIELYIFASYRRALNTSSAALAVAEIHFIIFNILLFVPLGILLPLLSIKLRRMHRIVFVGIVLSILIETSQLVWRLGIFSLEDIMHNTLGVFFGFGIYNFTIYLLTIFNKNS